MLSLWSVTILGSFFKVQHNGPRKMTNKSFLDIVESSQQFKYIHGQFANQHQKIDLILVKEI